jgi:mono/diheme cytochrome c family protein
MLLLIPGLACAQPGAREILRERCAGCHGVAGTQGKLDVRTREALLRGGAHGAAIVPGDAAASLLVRAVEGRGLPSMPPTGPLTAKEISLLRDWIAGGAKWESELPSNPRWALKPEDVWAFQPLSKPAGNSVDDFINAKLKTKAAPRTDKLTLIRRATFDLTGLPPTQPEIDAFIADSSATAFPKVVERLLASPQYGERWGRHWLDVVRYADTDGYSNDYERPNAWRYRDYVIRSFQTDKPYNQFVMEQIAGDEWKPGDPEAAVGTGFLRMGPWEQTAMSVAAITRQAWLDDVTHNTAATFLGLTAGCARCHDHKFDPIPTREYYGMQAAFASTNFAQRPAAFQPSENRADFNTERARMEQLVAYHRKAADALKASEDKGDMERERIHRKRWEIARRMLDRYKPLAFSVETKPAEDTFILTAGNLKSPGEKVPPLVLSAVYRYNPKERIELPQTAEGRRLQLAKWIAGADNPLTARVMVNRIWQYHFGRGIAGNPNNFGKMGKKPTHPELLDWLAERFIADGWSVKQMHRTMMLSDAYQRQAGPENEDYSSFAPRRLDAEELRDAILAVSGELSPDAGGPGTFPEINEDVGNQPRLIMGTLAPPYQPSPRRAQRNRRTIYTYQKRGIGDPMQEVFNSPSMNESCERREASTVPLQAFSLLNGKFARDMSLALAAKVEKDKDPIASLFSRTLHRAPSSKERAQMTALLAHPLAPLPPKPARKPLVRSLVGEHTGKRFDYQEEASPEAYEENLHASEVSPRARALAELALVLLNTNEFVYVY